MAYIFWHRPYREASQSAYESALVEFHQHLVEASPPGFQASEAHRISPTPWLGERDGYEDWYFVEAAWSLDPLNLAAVSGRVEASHDAVAKLMETGSGGLYDLVWGEPLPSARSRVAWLTRPRGIEYAPVLAEVRERSPGRLTCWRRRMVLGPAPEFALVVPASLDPTVPPGWHVLVIERVSLWPAQEAGRAL
ncbi:MAG: hypothetical protein ACE5JN_00735 [Candidatus Methylomirabilia bacterium]